MGVPVERGGERGPWRERLREPAAGRDDVAALEAHPASTGAGDLVGYRHPVPLAEVGDSCGVHNYRCGPGRDVGHERGDAAPEVTAINADSRCGRYAQRGREPAPAVLVLGLGPDKGGEPGGLADSSGALA